MVAWNVIPSFHHSHTGSFNATQSSHNYVEQKSHTDLAVLAGDLIAQWLEHPIGVPEIMGSIPT